MMMRRTTVLGSVLLFAIGGCSTALRGGSDNLTWLERAKSERPRSEPVLRALGIAYFKANRLSDAQSTLHEAVALDPNDGVAALYLGLTAEAQDDVAGARAAYASYLKVGHTQRVRAQLEARYATLTRKALELEATEAIAQESRLAARPGSPTTVAVLPFSFTGTDTSLKPLERGFAELLTTDLSRSSRLTVLERVRLQALLDEIALQQTGVATAGSGVRAGRLLGAGRLVGGSINQQGTQLRADAVVISVASAQTGAPASDAQGLEQLFTLEKNIALKLFDNLGVVLTTTERNSIEQRPTRSLAAFLSYSRGLELEDRGRFDDANRMFRDAVRLDPTFGPAQQKAQETRNLSAGSTVSAATIETSLVGSEEGAAANAATHGSTDGVAGGVAQALADGLNPSIVASAMGAAHGNTHPQKDPSAGTGDDNPTRRTAHVTVTITQPGRP